MENKALNKEFVESVVKLYEAFLEVEKNWDSNHINTSAQWAYPFHNDLGLVTRDVLHWKDACENGWDMNKILELRKERKEKMKSNFKMHYILDSKYDLIFSVEANSEDDARLVADKELRDDGLMDKHEVSFLEIS